MRRIAIARIAALCAVIASATACSSPTFVATGRFASDKGSACPYCGMAEWHPAWASDRATQQQQAQPDGGVAR
jgi:hypothetical protein